MSEEKDPTVAAVADDAPAAPIEGPQDASGEKTPAEDPAVDLAKQNEQTVAQTNAINEQVKASQASLACPLRCPCDPCGAFEAEYLWRCLRCDGLARVPVSSG